MPINGFTDITRLVDDWNDDPEPSSPNQERLEGFDCQGDVDSNRFQFSPRGYLYANEASEFLYLSGRIVDENDQCLPINLFGVQWDKGSVLHRHLEELFRMASKNLMILCNDSLINEKYLSKIAQASKSNKYIELRRSIVDFFKFLRSFILCLCDEPSYYWLIREIQPHLLDRLKTFLRHLGRLTSLPEYVYLHAGSPSGNKCTQASYNLFHTHLDIRWLHLTLLLVVDHTRKRILPSNHHPSDDHALQTSRDSTANAVERLLVELTQMAATRFTKLHRDELTSKSPFSCTCLQEIWILIVCLCDSMNRLSEGKNFWEYFEICLGVCDTETSIGQLPACSKTLFSLWMTHSAAHLYTFKQTSVPSNYPLLEKIVKSVVSGDDVDDRDLRVSLDFVEKLCLDLWEPKVEVMVSLWEYFHKRLNSRFYAEGATLDSMAVVSKDASGFLTQIDSNLKNRSMNCSSYHHFLRILGLHLMKTKDSPRSWKVIKGRIFSRLSPGKVSTLSEIGEYHLMSLLLTLALAVDTNELECKFVEIVNGFLSSKSVIPAEVLKGVVAFALLRLKTGRTIANVMTPVVDYVNSLPVTDEFQLVHLFADGVCQLFSVEASCSLGQYLVIDHWISNYLSECSEHQSAKFLDALISFLNRLKLLAFSDEPDKETILLVEKFWNQLSRYLETVPTQNSVHNQAADLAATLVNLYCDLGNHSRAKDVINIFARAEVGNVRVKRRFLSNLVHSKNCMISQYDHIITKAWIQFCFLCADVNHSEIKELTKYVVSVVDVKKLTDGHSINYLGDPLLSLFCSVGSKIGSSNDIFEKKHLKDKLCGYLEGMDSWMKPAIADPRDTDQILRIFTCSGNLVKHNAILLYTRSKPNTILQQLVDILFLPPGIRSPEFKIKSGVLQGVKKSLSLFIEGLNSLDPEQDPYISRTIKDLLTLYIPKCVSLNSLMSNASSFSLISEFPYLSRSTQNLLLGYVSNLFIKKKTRNPNQSMAYAIKYFKEILNLDDSNVYEVFIRNCFARICDVVMFCDEKSAVSSSTKSLLKTILISPNLRETMDIVVDSMATLCDDHLAWSSKQVYDLIVSVSTDAPDLVARFVPRLLEAVKLVEKKRGVTYDKNLRFGLERVENQLRNIKNVK